MKLILFFVFLAVVMFILCKISEFNDELNDSNYSRRSNNRSSKKNYNSYTKRNDKPSLYDYDLRSEERDWEYKE